MPLFPRDIRILQHFPGLVNTQIRKTYLFNAAALSITSNDNGSLKKIVYLMYVTAGVGIGVTVGVPAS